MLAIFLWSACDSHTTEFEGKWQLAEIEYAGNVTPVDTVWYNFQTSLFQYQIYDRTTDQYLAVHGYHTYENGILSLDLFQSTEDERNFLDKLESLTRKNCIVVIATQVMLEGSDVELYEVGFKAMSRYHLLQAYDMTTEALVAKLMWLLPLVRAGGDLRQLFYTPVSLDILASALN